MTDTPHQGVTPHDTGPVSDFDIGPGRVGTERKRAEEASAVVELLWLAHKALSINEDKTRQWIERAIALLGAEGDAVDTVERGSVSNEDNRAEVVLTSTEQELRLLVEAIPTLVWRAAPDGNFEYVNKRMLEYLGAPLSEVIGWGWMDKVHPDDVAFKVRSWLQNLESGKPHDVVCRIRGADGRYRWFEVRGEPLRASDGTVLSWYGVLIDIDDRRRAEEALRESEYKLRQITETQPGLLWSNGPNGEPTHINQRMLDYSGMRFEDFKLRGWEAFVHDRVDISSLNWRG
jgi:PAS domain S-box-containing protein